jgi:hypothetical protein
MEDNSSLDRSLRTGYLGVQCVKSTCLSQLEGMDLLGTLVIDTFLMVTLREHCIRTCRSRLHQTGRLAQLVRAWC